MIATTCSRAMEGRLAVLTLDRPSVLNAIDAQMATELISSMNDLSRDRSVRVIALTGVGPKAFCVGADLKERDGKTAAWWRRHHKLVTEMYRTVRNCPKPLIAAVNGLALGGGCELALSADVIIATSNASFGQPEVERGIIPGGGGTQLLPRRLPRSVALELLMTGATISAADAHRHGLVNHLCEPPKLLQCVEEMAAQIAANSPFAVRLAKLAARSGLDRPLEEGLAIEAAAYRRTLRHPDRLEGVSAFIQRRTPDFSDE